MLATKPCGWCGDLVAWVEVAGKPVPLEPEPVDDGQYVVTASVLEGTSLERNVAERLLPGADPHPERLRYRKHTCPRRGRRSGR